MQTNGLEGVVIGDTALSSVDGERGELLIRGLPIAELSGLRTFSEVCALMWTGDAQELETALGHARNAAFGQLPRLGGALQSPSAMDALRAATAHVEPRGDWELDACRITASVSVFAAAWSRINRGLEPVAPDPETSHAADYLRMVHGHAVEPSWADALDAYWATVVDHGMNASTFAARVVASTESDLVSAVVAAIGALKGRLRGGAPGPVLDMLDDIDSPDQADRWIRAELDAGRRIMGMGHRVYRVRDPRAAVLERALEALAGSGKAVGRLELARAVERAAEHQLAERKPGRSLRANVEFYTATLLEAIGLDRNLFTATFAASRVVGWCAHVREQREEGRLIRPRVRYVGPRPPAQRAN